MIKRFRAYLFAAVLIAVFPFIIPHDFFLHLGQDIAILAIGAIGLNILLGFSGQLSLGQTGFFALGAYGSAVLATRLGWPLPLSFAAGLAVASLAGLALGLVALRTRTHYLAMVTLAFGYIVAIVAQRAVGVTGGAMGLLGVPQLNFGDVRQGAQFFFWTVAGTLLLVQMVSDYIAQSGVGRNLHAIKESESFALTVGINAPVWRAGTFVFSDFTAGLAGCFFAHQSGYVGSDAFGFDRSVSLLIAVVIGGLGRSSGALLGSIIVVLLNQLTAGLYEVAFYIFGSILLSVMLFFPAGAAGALSAAARLWRRPGAAPAPAAAGTVPSLDLPPGNVASGQALLVLEGVTKSYAGVVAVNDVSFTVRAGTIHALIGPNGAGKSTLINVISGLYAANSGSLRFAGTDIAGLPANRRARLGITRTFQNLQLIGTQTVVENVMLGLPQSTGPLRGFFDWLAGAPAEAAQRTRALALLRFLGIEQFADSMPGDLSYGHRKLCELARALAQSPRLMLLDEPIAGLNESEVKEIVAVIGRLRQAGVTVLLVEHNMPFVMSVSDTVTVLDYGRKIAEGRPEQVRANPEVVAAYLGKDAA